MTMAKTQLLPRAFPGAPAARPAGADPLLAPPSSMPESPLLRDELPPLRPGLLDVSPVGRRMENLDALRIVCMLVIIITHVTGPYLLAEADRLAAAGPARGPTPYGPLFRTALAVNVASRFGVPCFMMISFFIYWHQLYEKGRTWGELLRRRFKRLVPAFVCWSCFYFLVHKIVQRTTGELHPVLRDMNWKRWETWVDVFVWGKAEYHLYYLPVIMQCLLLIPLLRLLWKKPAVTWGFIGAMAAVWYVVLYGLLFFKPGSPAWELADKTREIVHEETALPLLVFPLFGMVCAGQSAWRNWVARTPDRLWWGLLALGVALHVAESQLLLPHSFNRALVALKLGRLMTAGACFVLFLRRPLMRDPLPKVSHYAFGLHFMHPFVILMLGFVEARLLGPSVARWQAHVVPMLAVNLVLTVSLTFGLCLLVGRFKRLEFLVV